MSWLAASAPTESLLVAGPPVRSVLLTHLVKIALWRFACSSAKSIIVDSGTVVTLGRSAAPLALDCAIFLNPGLTAGAIK